jgi:glutamyl-tRNA(Gln) amidotransferase subunit D
LQTGDRVACTYAGSRLEGTYITERDGKRVLKLDSGYNIGVPPECCQLLDPAPPLEQPQQIDLDQDSSLPHLSIVSTGGTIASKIDYRTGAVTSQFTAAELMRAIPGLGSIGQYRTVQLASILSENMTPLLWQELARAVYQEIRDGAEGVIVTHGTDTMAYSAAAVSFMLKTPVPVIFVGSQRSADRPSSDNLMNGLCSARAAVSDLGEVAVVMHQTSSDDFCAIHRATRVRKMHTSRRDAFQSIGSAPIGTIAYPSLEVNLADNAVRRQPIEPELADRLEERCGLLQFVPGLSPDILAAYEGYRGLVLSGTGLGHVSTAWFRQLGSMIEDGTTIVMTSQCLYGRVCDRVYDTGRDLLKLGVVEGGTTLPEVALVKLMWVLGQEKDEEKAKRMMATDLRGEAPGRSAHGL